MAAERKQSCYLCKFHNVYWEGDQFAGCECRAWDDPEMREKYHVCGRSLSPEASRRSGQGCPRFVYFPPDDFID